SSPAGLFSGKIKHRLGAWRLVEQRPAIRNRVLFCRGRHLVDEALGHEHIVRGADAATERGRNTRWPDAHKLHMALRQVVDEIDRALGRIRVKAVLEVWWDPPCNDGGAREAIIPGDRFAVLVEPG